jgi:hypothetical protein
MREAALNLDLRRLARDVRWPAFLRAWRLMSWPYAMYRELGIPRVFRQFLEAEGVGCKNSVRAPEKSSTCRQDADFGTPTGYKMATKFAPVLATRDAMFEPDWRAELVGAQTT